MMAKDLFGHSVSMPTPAFVLWNEQMSAHDVKIAYAVYRFSPVVHNLSSNQGLSGLSNEVPRSSLLRRNGHFGYEGWKLWRMCKGKSGATEAPNLFFSSM